MHETPKQTQERHPGWLRVYTFAFHACWIVILLVAARHRFALPAAPLTDRDVWGYLSPALEKIVGHAFVQSEGRGFVYPGLIYLILCAFRSLSAVTKLQHVLGLVTGLLLLNNWTIARRLLRRPHIPGAVHDLAGLGLFAIFLLCAQSTFSEHHLRPEAIAPLFTMLGFGFTIRFLLAKHRSAQPQRALWFGAASLCVAFLLPLLKPSFLLTSILTTLPIWWHLFDRRETGRKRLAMAGIPVLAAWLLLWMPEARYAAADPGTQIFLPASLFTIHAPQIRAQMASDLQDNSASVPYPREQLQSILDLLDSEMELSRPTVHHSFALLGFNPDYLLYEDSFCRKLSGILPERTARADFYRYYFRRAWQQRPGAMMRKFADQLGLFYNLDCRVYEHHMATLDRPYQEGADYLSEPNRYPLVAQVPAAAQYVASLPALATTHIQVTQSKKFKVVLPVFAHTYLPGLFLALAACAWLFVDAESRAACGHFATVVALGYAYNLGNNVAIALFHTLGVGRYSHVQLATTLLTQALSLWLVIEVIVRMTASAVRGSGDAAPVQS